MEAGICAVLGFNQVLDPGHRPSASIFCIRTLARCQSQAVVETRKSCKKQWILGSFNPTNEVANCGVRWWPRAKKIDIFCCGTNPFGVDGLRRQATLALVSTDFADYLPPHNVASLDLDFVEVLNQLRDQSTALLCGKPGSGRTQQLYVGSVFCKSGQCRQAYYFDFNAATYSVDDMKSMLSSVLPTVSLIKKTTRKNPLKAAVGDVFLLDNMDAALVGPTSANTNDSKHSSV